MEVPGIVVRLALLQAPSGIASSGVLDLHHLGAEPGQGLRARGPRFELGEIDDANAFQTVELDTAGHARSPIGTAMLDRASYASMIGIAGQGPHSGRPLLISQLIRRAT